MAANFNIDRLIALGDDAISSQFSVYFRNIPGQDDVDPTILTLRADQAIDLPERTIATYDIMYKGVKIVKLASAEETDKNFQISFRIDQNFDVFRILNKWFISIFDENFASIRGGDLLSIIGLPVGPLKDNNATTIVFEFYKQKGQLAHSVRFDGARIRSLDVTGLDPASGEPMRATAGFAYLRSNYEGDYV